jgi:hypothetical protein
MRVYVASKAKHAGWWQALRASGLDICATWVDWPFNHNGCEPSPADWAEHWQKCVDQAATCDVLLLHAIDGEVQRGALIELGAALATNRKVFIVSPYDWSWKHHPAVTVFSSLADAIKALIPVVSDIPAVQRKNGKDVNVRRLQHMSGVS